MFFRKFCLVGEPGDDLEVPVPVGVVVRSDDDQILGKHTQ